MNERETVETNRGDVSASDWLNSEAERISKKGTAVEVTSRTTKAKGTEWALVRLIRETIAVDAE